MSTIWIARNPAYLQLKQRWNEQKMNQILPAKVLKSDYSISFFFIFFPCQFCYSPLWMNLRFQFINTIPKVFTSIASHLAFPYCLTLCRAYGPFQYGTGASLCILFKKSKKNFFYQNQNDRLSIKHCILCANINFKGTIYNQCQFEKWQFFFIMYYKVFVVAFFTSQKRAFLTNLRSVITKIAIASSSDNEGCIANIYLESA